MNKNLMIFYVLILSPLVSANDIEYKFRDGISFKYGGFRGQSIKVDIRDNKMLVSTFYEPTKLLDNWCTASVSDSLLGNIVSTLKDLGADKWQDRYDNQGVKDGYHFNLVVKYKRFWREYSGSNNKPETFDKFVDYIDTLVADNGCEIPHAR